MTLREVVNMSDFSPFLDCSKLSDDEIFDKISKLNSRINYYNDSAYAYLVPQLQEWKDGYLDELHTRAEKRAADKAKSKGQSNVIFDNSTEVLEQSKQAEEAKAKEKEILKDKLKLK